MTAKEWTVLDLLNWTREFFESRKLVPARRQAEDLLCKVLDLDRLHLYLQFEMRPTPSELAMFRNMVQRRAEGEPLQYLLGWQPFLGLKIKTDRRALIPRPETEMLADKLVKRFQSWEGLRIADLGTGTGCLALVLARLPGARVWATDKSPEALALAAENAAGLQMESALTLLRGDWFEPLKAEGLRGLDLVVSNPPYIPRAEASGLSREVRDFEPPEALFAGEDGKACLRLLLREAPAFLKGGGCLALECGDGQAEGLAKEFSLGGIWEKIWTESDACGKARFLFALKVLA